jgi:hypothetical protein
MLWIFVKKLEIIEQLFLAYLMKAFMVSQERPFIPELIQEIPNFKSWVLGCLKDGPKTLIGHIDMHLLNFFCGFI